jgi:hypothetical protein
MASRRRANLLGGFPHKEHGLLYAGLAVVLLVGLIIGVTPDTSTPQFIAPISGFAEAIIAAGPYSGLLPIGTIEIAGLDTPEHAKITATRTSFNRLHLVATATGPGGELFVTRLTPEAGTDLTLFFALNGEPLNYILETNGDLKLSRNNEFILAGNVLS